MLSLQEKLIISSQNRQPLIICGPTASGKTQLALDLALNLANNKSEIKIAIINLDAYQVYIDAPICSASPNEQEKLIVPHKLFNYIKHDEHYSVGRYIQDCHQAIEDVFSQNQVPVLVGGSSMYIHSLINGIRALHSVSQEAAISTTNTLKSLGLLIYPQIRQYLESNLSSSLHKCQYEIDNPHFDDNYPSDIDKEQYLSSSRVLYDKIAACLSQDHVEHFKTKVHPHDLQRIIRVYAFYLTTGKYLYDSNIENQVPYKFLVHSVLLPRDELYSRADKRVHNMVAAGAIEEVKSLMPIWDQCKSIKSTLLVSELYDYLSGKLSLHDAISLAQLKTRRLIKKQLCWLRNKIPHSG